MLDLITKLKFIVVFIIIKIIPLLLILYIVIKGANEINDYYNKTKNIALSDSSKNLEKINVLLANRISDFLYERNSDILFLSRISLKKNGQQILNSFFHTKRRNILIQTEYEFNSKNQKWQSKNNKEVNNNKKQFHYAKIKPSRTKSIPIYKEVTLFNLNAQEIYKKSDIEALKMNISDKNNTYAKSENYWNEIQNLREGEIYVSNVIGAYVSSNTIGTFTNNKLNKMEFNFEAKSNAYAGLENPNGKRFEGIIRFVTPIYRNFKKVAYLSLALDHRHIMEFTDTFNPSFVNIKQNISDASNGSYASMWDNKARNISHPRDYFIVAYNPKTSKRVRGWLSNKIESDFNKSNQKDMNLFLEEYLKFNSQNLNKKEEMALDCSYLNFIPQCQDWMNLTKNGGHGSVIYKNKVLKISSVASIPYYTGQYGLSKRGFGFVSIQTNIKNHNINKEVFTYIKILINEFTYLSIFIVLLLIIISSYIISKIK